MCRNKSTQSDLGAPFLLGAPSGRGVRGALPPALRLGFDHALITPPPCDQYVT